MRDLCDAVLFAHCGVLAVRPIRSSSPALTSRYVNSLSNRRFLNSLPG